MIVIRRERYSFPVVGTPVSMQSSPSSKRRYQRLVTLAASNAVQKPIENGETIKLEIDWFSEGFRNKPDVDNIIKPIQDALKGVVFSDDNQVESALARKRDLLKVVQFNYEPLYIIEPLLSGHKEYVYIRIF